MGVNVAKKVFKK